MPADIELTLAHSPDSDDLVMWWPLTGMHPPAGYEGEPIPAELRQPQIDTEGMTFRLVPSDVEQLNHQVTDGSAPFDITAISAATYPSVRTDWRITRCGGSFGVGYGPKTVVRSDSPVRAPGDLQGKSIAVPGTRTSAFMTLSMLLGPGSFEPTAMLFSDVPAAVVSGDCDAGLLIHEAQLTFGDLGLRAVVDVGQWWTELTGMALPLGLNVIRRDLDTRFGGGTCERLSRVLSRSVEYAVAHADESRRYLLLHGADRPEWQDAALVERYLSMYVSAMSREMGDDGVRALERFLGDGSRAGLCPDAGVIDVV